MGGVSALLYESIEAWNRLLSRQATTEEIEILLALDIAYRNGVGEISKKPAASGKPPPARGFLKA